MASSDPRKPSRIPASLQAVFMLSNRGFTVDKPPPERSASKVFRRFLPAAKRVEKKLEPWSTFGTRRASTNSSSTWSMVSMEPMVSPQSHLDALLSTRGYTAVNHRSSVAVESCTEYDDDNAILEPHYDAYIVDIVKRDNPEPLRALLQQGVAQNPCNSIGESIASLASRFGAQKILKVLLEAGCDPLAKDEYGRTCLHQACRAKEPNWGIVDLLLDRHVDLLSCMDNQGMSPLAYVKPHHWDDWIQFLNSKADTYFPRRKAKVSTMIDATNASESEDGSDSSVGDNDDSLSDVLFSAYENEMAELMAIMDARMGRKLR